MQTNKEELKKYEDIIHVPHHQSNKRVRMDIKDRAAQFAPFAAVVGHDAAIKEVGRYTDHRKELDEMQKAIIDVKLQEVIKNIANESEIDVIFFRKDRLKAGGVYVNKVGVVKKIDEYQRKIIFKDGEEILIKDIYNLE